MGACTSAPDDGTARSSALAKPTPVGVVPQPKPMSRPGPALKDGAATVGVASAANGSGNGGNGNSNGNGVAPPVAARPSWHPPAPGTAHATVVAAGTAPVGSGDPQASCTRAPWTSAAAARQLLQTASERNAAPVECMKLRVRVHDLLPDLFVTPAAATAAAATKTKKPALPTLPFAVQMRRYQPPAAGQPKPGVRQFEPIAPDTAAFTGRTEWHSFDAKLNGAGSGAAAGGGGSRFGALLMRFSDLTRSSQSAGACAAVDTSRLVRIALVVPASESSAAAAVAGTGSDEKERGDGTRTSGDVTVVGETTPMTVMGLLECSGRTFSLFAPRSPDHVFGDGEDEDDPIPDAQRVGQLTLDDVCGVVATTTALTRQTPGASAGPGAVAYTRLFAERTECALRCRTLVASNLPKASALGANRPLVQFVDATPSAASTDTTVTGPVTPVDVATGGVVRYTTRVAGDDPHTVDSALGAAGADAAPGTVSDGGARGDWPNVWMPLERLTHGDVDDVLLGVRVLDRSAFGGHKVIAHSGGAAWSVRQLLRMSSDSGGKLVLPLVVPGAAPPTAGTGPTLTLVDAQLYSTTAELDRQALKCIRDQRWPEWDKSYRNTLPGWCERHLLYALLLLNPDLSAAAASGAGSADAGGTAPTVVAAAAANGNGAAH